jgi:hypothetical protein
MLEAKHKNYVKKLIFPLNVLSYSIVENMKTWPQELSKSEIKLVPHWKVSTYLL